MIAAARLPHNQTLQRTGRAPQSSLFESASGARPAAERPSVMQRPALADEVLDGIFNILSAATVVIASSMG